MALRGDPRQHEQRPRLVVHRYRVLASRRPLGGAVGTWWPTKDPGVYGAGMEQPCGICLRGGGFGGAAWRPDAARAAPSFGGSSVPGFSEPAASGVGGAVGTWRPTTGPGVHGAGMEQPCGVCLRGGGFGRAAWRPDAARAAPSIDGSSVPGFSEPAAPGGRRGDLAAYKRPRRAQRRH